MQQIVSQIADATGIDPATTEKALGMMLSFLQREAEGGDVEAMIAAFPGASEMIAQYGGGGGGFMSGLMGGGVMGLGQQLMGLGLGMGEITALAKQTIAIAKQYAGEEVVDQVVASIPGLGQFI